jgi:dolichol-phosphate mannosyltransferase
LCSRSDTHELHTKLAIFAGQFLASQPVNPSGFKIGLELLLKTPLLPSQLVHVPYGFAKRQVGTSKLGMKVIIKYIGQLLALYQWRFGLLFYIFVFTVTAGVVQLAMLSADYIVRRFGLQENQLGRAVLKKRTKYRHKSDV